MLHSLRGDRVSDLPGDAPAFKDAMFIEQTHHLAEGLLQTRFGSDGHGRGPVAS
jgi:hypothetical protein